MSTPTLRLLPGSVNCSGDMYAGVPPRIWARTCESPSGPRSWAMPQSTTTISPYSPTITLSGLRSLWSTPRRWL